MTTATTPTASNPESAIASLGLKLPPAPKPAGSYIPWRRVGNTLFLAGQIPLVDGKPIATGIVSVDVDLATAGKCAEQCVLNGLAVIKSAIGDLAKVKQVVRIGVFVASPSTYTEHPKVGNFASELLTKIFGERGQHVRAAVGAPSLPLGVPVEIDFIVEVE